jgi:hypothetical protein
MERVRLSRNPYVRGQSEGPKAATSAAAHKSIWSSSNNSLDRNCIPPVVTIDRI